MIKKHNLLKPGLLPLAAATVLAAMLVPAKAEQPSLSRMVAPQFQNLNPKPV
jgi:hypothetical protein